ncbi:MAG: formate dehydrogenase accessory protein FdhE [Desulfovibrio sp.]|nr:formate dehydrogenase accessory protein FdhE [Desulfovibrio sp.]
MPSTKTPAETLTDIVKRRPALRSILEAFAPIYEEQEKQTERLVPVMKEKGLSLPVINPSRFNLGVSLLTEKNLPHFGPLLSDVASGMAAVLRTLPQFNGHTDGFDALFRELSVDDEEKLINACTKNDPSIVQELAKSHNMPLPNLMFAVEMIVPVLFRALRRRSLKDSTPWDENNMWQQGYCPVCGSYPTIAWLDKPVVDERNTYLSEGGGRKHLHCGVCGANWRFLRLGCPFCSVSKSKQLEMFSEEKNPYGESVDFCSDCHCYYPTVDLRERTELPNLDAQALGMMHLDIIAREKELTPLRHSFWNTFSA